MSLPHLSVSLSTFFVPYAARQAQRKNDTDQLKQNNTFDLNKHDIFLITLIPTSRRI